MSDNSLQLLKTQTVIWKQSVGMTQSVGVVEIYIGNNGTSLIKLMQTPAAFGARMFINSFS